MTELLWTTESERYHHRHQGCREGMAAMKASFVFFGADDKPLCPECARLIGVAADESAAADSGGLSDDEGAS